MSSKQTILAVDDDPMIHKLLNVRLKDIKANLLSATSGPEGIALAADIMPDLILLDVSMPDINGFEVCQQLRNNARTRDIPIIFLTGSDNAEEKARGFELGASDYVTKPFDPGELRARVKSALRQQALVAALEAQANTDSLTGLPNRAAFKRRLNLVLEHARNRATKFALLFIDLDRFKQVNDSLGHAAGDSLLLRVSDILRSAIRQPALTKQSRGTDFIARMGGDEFTVIFDDVSDDQYIINLGERLRNALTRSFEIEGNTVHIGASIGIRICNAFDTSPDAIIRDSDTAMYQAKAQGKGRCVVFDEQMHRTVVERLELEQDLHLAVENEELHLFYQPIVDLENGALVGFEALLRWEHPTRGFVTPLEFIHIAEETGLIVQIGAWVLKNACRQLRRWKNHYSDEQQVYMSVNLSKAQLMHPDIEKLVQETMHDYEIQKHELILEVTESTIMHDTEVIVPVLDKFRSFGVRLAMDDFGTGYSSLASLHRFPIDILKIDRQFINSMLESRDYAAVVNAIVTLADNLGMDVIAEGIETEDHLFLLQAMACQLGQGYYFSKPIEADDMTQKIEDKVWFGKVSSMQGPFDSEQPEANP